jgi:hypothetical protein
MASIVARSRQGPWSSRCSACTRVSPGVMNARCSPSNAPMCSTSICPIRRKGAPRFLVPKRLVRPANKGAAGYRRLHVGAVVTPASRIPAQTDSSAAPTIGAAAAFMNDPG